MATGNPLVIFASSVGTGSIHPLHHIPLLHLRLLPSHPQALSPTPTLQEARPPLSGGMRRHTISIDKEKSLIISIELPVLWATVLSAEC